MKVKPLLAIIILALSFTPFIAISSQGQTALAGGYVDTTYKIASTSRTGSLFSGQPADIMLSGIGFNNSGGPLLFNHLGGCATDDQHLIVADTYNNRILIWNSAPGPNTPPDIVLGQRNFYSNSPGHGLDGLDWPIAVSAGGGKLVVADTYNNRILIWNTFPTVNDQPADLEIEDQGFSFSTIYQTFTPLRSIVWPWGVWTDGNKMAISSTGGSYVLIWNTFPTSDNQSANLYLTASGKFGTPRAITSDGTHLIVGDHNAKDQITDTGSFVWNTFPTQNDSKYDYFISQSAFTPQGSGYFRGTLLRDGRTILLGTQLYIFNSFPTNNQTKPDLILGSLMPYSTVHAYLDAGAGGACVLGSKLYLSLDNENKILVYNRIPNSSSTEPDYAIGAPNPYTNTLDTHFFFTNPNPVTDGKHLFVASDFDNKLYVYKNLPDQSGAYPDVVYDFRSVDFQPSAIALYNNTLALAGMQDVYIWKSLPLDAQPPDIHFSSGIGNVKFQDLTGIAMDSHHFYLSDQTAGKIYVWNGIPSNDTNPVITLSTDQPARLSTDGRYLVVAATFSLIGSHVRVYSLSNLSSNSQPVSVGTGMFNLPQSAIVARGGLFVADTSNNRVFIWDNITNALKNSSVDIVLGCTAYYQICYNDPQIGKNTLFWPGTLAFDGKFLWVGEFKFSGRLLRFSIGNATTISPRSELYDIQAGSDSFVAALRTNTTTTAMGFSDSNKSLSINSTESTPGYVNVTFPTNLLNGSLKAYIDGSSIVPEMSQNNTYTSVYVVVPPGDQHVKIYGMNTIIETTSTTSITNTGSNMAACYGIAGSVSTLEIQPCSGPSGTVASISGNGLTPNNQYQYCLEPGPPPSPGSASNPCPSNAPTFTTLSDGSIPDSATLQVTGTPGQYSVVIRDPAQPQFIVWLNFVITASVSTSSTSSTFSTTLTSISSTTSTSSTSQSSSGSTTTVSLPRSVSSTTSRVVPNLSNYAIYLAGGAVVIIIAASLIALRKKRQP